MDGIDQQEGNTPSLATTAAATESGGSINENRDTLLRENNSGDHPGSGSELNTRSVEIDSSMVSYSIAVIVSVKNQPDLRTCNWNYVQGLKCFGIQVFLLQRRLMKNFIMLHQ